MLFLAGCTPPDSLPAPEIIPAPAELSLGEGIFILNTDTKISVSQPEAEATAELLASMLRPATGLALSVENTGTIELSLEPGLPEEGYTLTVQPDGVRLTASDKAGLFYGVQTFLQLFPATIFSKELVSQDWEIPVVSIEDAPRFSWRGVMIDVARHFFTVEEIKRQIDLFALHKLNRLHLHLSDDQGWRIEIKSWPLLTEIGGSTEVGGGPGGFYTQEEYKDLVEYSASRNIILVPEIDFPGHCNAALASYGELNEDGQPTELYTGTGVGLSGIWLGSESSYRFVEDVWTELAALTPGPWLHVGADEAKQTSEEDYADFVLWEETMVGSLEKTMIGWDELGVLPIQAPTIAQYWYDEARALAAVTSGAQLIASPAEHAYLDMVYDQYSTFGQIWVGPVNIERSYRWDPVLEGMDESMVLGVEAALWTEYIDTEEKVDFMVWPRLSAIAEVAWSDHSDWTDFRERLAGHGQRLQSLEVGFYASPEIDWE